jgi:hypothetical protein
MNHKDVRLPTATRTLWESAGGVSPLADPTSAGIWGTSHYFRVRAFMKRSFPAMLCNGIKKCDASCSREY